MYAIRSRFTVDKSLASRCNRPFFQELWDSYSCHWKCRTVLINVTYSLSDWKFVLIIHKLNKCVFFYEAEEGRIRFARYSVYESIFWAVLNISEKKASWRSIVLNDTGISCNFYALTKGYVIPDIVHPMHCKQVSFYSSCCCFFCKLYILRCKLCISRCTLHAVRFTF